MDKKRRVEVVINGQPHAFVTSESEEYIRGLADYLNEKIAEVTGTNFGNLLANDKKYIVTAMNILDDYYKILSKYEAMSKEKSAGKNKNLDLINDYESKLKTLQKQNAKLSESLESLEYELKYVQNLYKEQKQEYEQLLENATKPDAKL